MKKFILVLCLLLFFIFVVGCNSTDKVQAEQFQQEFKQVESKYDEAIKKYNETYDSKYLSDAEFYLNKMKTMTGEK